MFKSHVSRKVVAAMVLCGGALISGCHTELRKDINDIRKRIDKLEDATGILSQRLAEGAMIKSFAPLADNAGWRIEFAGGNSRIDMQAIEIYHGKHGMTPKLDVFTRPDGTVTLRYNITVGYPDSGWIDTGLDLSADKPGTQGPQGPPGPQGEPGGGRIPGGGIADMEFKVQTNPGGDGGLWVWCSPKGGKLSPLCPVGSMGPIAAIVENPDGTVTFIMSDDRATRYTFAQYSTARHFEIVLCRPIVGGVDVVFRVNPSTASVPRGVRGEAALAKWALDLVDNPVTRAGYVTATDALWLHSVLPDGDKTGQYIATIGYDKNFAYDVEYPLTLVLNNGSDDSPELISSGTFTVVERNVEVPITLAVFKDPQFLEFVTKLNLDTDGNGTLSTEERHQVLRIDVSGTTSNAGSITSLAGIENFPWLVSLKCLFNPGLTTIDLSQNTLLGTLYINNMSDLKTLDLSKHIEMRDLICSNCGIEKLDVSNSPHLKFLNCTTNLIKKLSLPNNPKLLTLTCWENNLTELDLSGCPNLTTLRCERNLLTRLDVSNNPLLYNIFCTGNPGAGGIFEVNAWFEWDSATATGFIPKGGFNGTTQILCTTTAWEYPAGSGNLVNVKYMK